MPVDDEMAGPPTLFGARYSVYTRIARLALGEKGVSYRLIEVDVFDPGGLSAEYLARHPFGRIPAFEHRNVSLYEAGAITRYVDEAFPGPALQPREAAARARMNQVISIMDAYAFRTLVWDVFVERERVPAKGGTPDEEKIAAALPKAKSCLRALEDILGVNPWFAGTVLSLADLHAAPMFFLFRLAPEGGEMLTEFPALGGWLDAIANRPATIETRHPLEPASRRFRE